MKAVKWILGIAAGLLVLLVVVVAIVAATFDPNQYKPQIVDLVKQKTGRTLTMDGKIGLSFFPRIGAEVERVALSGPKGQGTFAKVEEARVAVALLPLLSKQVIVDKVVLTGLAVDLVRYKDGRTNFDDLIGAEGKPDEKRGQKPAPAGPALAIDVGGIALKDAAIRWRDERDGIDLRLLAVDLETGRIASGVPGKLKLDAKVDGKQPQLRMQIDLSTRYVLDFAGGGIALSALDLKAIGDAPGAVGLDARVKGEKLDVDPAAKRFDLAGIELAAKSKDGLDATFAIPRLQLAPDRAESKAISGAVKLAKPGQAVDAKLALAALEAKGKQIQFSRLDVDVDAKTGQLSVQGKLATPVTLNLEASQVSLPGITGDVAVSGPDIPNKSLRVALKGGARADWAKQSANAELAAKLDESNIQAKLAVAHWSKPAINFDLVADRLNVDRYLPQKPAAKPGPGGGAPVPASGGGAGAEKPIDLGPLKTLNASGSVKIGALQVQNIKADNVNVGLKAADGRLDVNPMSASLYQGTLAGSAAVNANNNSFAVKQQLAGISVGPLIRDAANKDILEGRGNVAFDVTTAGQTPTALKKALNGTASVALKDGAIKGVDVAGLLRQAKAILGSKGAIEEQAKGGRKTDFTELTGSFAIKNGVAHNEDLQAKSPLVRLAGAGDINIGEGTMDYTLKASLVATSTGQGGKDVADVRGITAPVRITGSFDHLKYSVDVAALATDAAKDALARELERRLGGGQAGKAGAQGGKASGGSTRDILRGILGR
ncbi:MAG TPA: AsmA family protein [Burkholderiales bacterium]|nr:AsmA family protein [Burkholderiales bacterium]